MGARNDPVEETPLRLRIAGQHAAAWTCSPGALEALAAGWLLSEGAVEQPADLTGLALEAGAMPTIHVELGDVAAARFRALQAHRRQAGCGLRHFLDCDPGGIRAGARTGSSAGDRPHDSAAGRARDPGPQAAAALLSDTYALAERYRRTGGLHIASLVADDRIVGWSEDVGRHNAADKVIGRAWLDGRDLAGCGLVLSARISAALALKAGRAGLGWIASRSVPTTLALEIAAAAGVTILARTGGSEPRRFAPDTWRSAPGSQRPAERRSGIAPATQPRAAAHRPPAEPAP